MRCNTCNSLPRFCGCGKQGVTREIKIHNNSLGRDGESAYEIYLRKGGELSENEWIESLKGKDGRDGNNINIKGSVGLYSDLENISLLPEIGDAWAVSEDGALYVYGENGFPAQGEGVIIKGDKGDIGNTGPKGDSPSINTEGNWVIGNLDTGLKAVNDFLNVDTVNDLKSLSENNIQKLKNGVYKGVTLQGYYQKNDTPAAITYYLVESSFAEDMGSVFKVSDITLQHKFNTPFSPRYFGIVSNGTLDQSSKINRYCRYVDDNNIYEIDFENMHLMTPTTEAFKWNYGSISVRGMYFTKVHKVKNLKISNDKVNKLTNGVCCLAFYPKSDGEGVFELANVVFDPYTSNYQLSTASGDGYYDGWLHGFIAHGFAGSWSGTETREKPSGYEFKFTDIEFISPAISYNMTTHMIYSKKVHYENVKGQYWGLFCCDMGLTQTYRNVRGILRNDYQNGSGRVLVQSLIHSESEVGYTSSKTYTCENLIVEDCFVNNYIHTLPGQSSPSFLPRVWGQHSAGINNFKSAIFLRNHGNISFFDNSFDSSNSATPKEGLRCNINFLLIKDHVPRDYGSTYSGVADCSLYASVSRAIIENSYFNFSEWGLITRTALSTGVYDFINCKIRNLGFPYQVGGMLSTLNFTNCSIEPNTPAGVIDNSNVFIQNIVMRDCISKKDKLFKCGFTSVKLTNVEFTVTRMGDTIEQMRGNQVSTVDLTSVFIDGSREPQDAAFLKCSATGSSITYRALNCYFGVTLRTTGSVNRDLELECYPVRSSSTLLTGLEDKHRGMRIYDNVNNVFKTWTGSSWI